MTLVDAARELGSDLRSVASPAGAEYFSEHVHLRWEGNYALVRGARAPVRAALVGAADAAETTRWLDDEACARAVGFTEFGRLAMLGGMSALTNRPPFTGRRCHRRPELAVQKGFLLAGQGRFGEAEKVLLAADAPFFFQTYGLLASVWIGMGRTKEATERFERLAARMPDSRAVRSIHAGLLARRGDLAGGDAVAGRARTGARR